MRPVMKLLRVCGGLIDFSCSVANCDCNLFVVYTLATDIKSSRKCVCLGTVYGVIGKIQILAGKPY